MAACAQILYTLSHHKPQAEKLYQSLLDLELTPESEITADHIAKMEYLDWVRSSLSTGSNVDADSQGLSVH